MSKGLINLYIVFQKHKFDQIAARNIWISLEKPIAFLKVKLRQLWRKMYEGKDDTCDKNLFTVFVNSSNHSRPARNHITECK